MAEAKMASSKTKAQTTGKTPSSEAVNKKIEPVVQNAVKTRRKGFLSKLKADPSSDLQTVGEYVMLEIVIPAAKRTISDVVSQGVDKILYGDARPRRGRGGSGGSYIHYSSSSRYRDYEERRPRNISPRARKSHDFDEVVFDTYDDAMSVIEAMVDLVEKYDSVSVGDFYELAGLSVNFMDRKWGWVSMAQTKAIPVRGGYIVDFPETQPLG